MTNRPSAESHISRRSILRGGILVTAGYATGTLGWFTSCGQAFAQAQLGSSLASWAFNTLADHAKQKAGDMLWSTVMGFLGMGESGDDPQLDKISSQLESINQTLLNLQESVKTLENDFKEGKEEIKAVTSGVAYKAHVDALDRLFGSSEDGPERVSLAGLLAAKRAGQPPNTKALVVAIDREAQKHIDGIYDTMAKPAVATNAPLLEQWANFLIAKLHRPQGQPDFERLVPAYAVLEGYFLQGLSAQLKGVALRAARLGLNGGADAASANSKARAAFMGTYREEADRFLWATERLVFALTSIHSDGDMANGPLEIFRRADVVTNGLGSILSGQTGDLQSLFSGTYGRVLCRATDPIEAGSKPGTVRINGGEQPGAMPRHFSGIAWPEFGPLSAGYLPLLPARQSQLKIVRVRRPFLPWPEPTRVLPAGSPMTTPANGYVDLTTFETTRQRSASTVNAGGYVDRRRVSPGTTLPAAVHTVDHAPDGMSAVEIKALTPGRIAGLQGNPPSLELVSVIKMRKAFSEDPSLEQTFRQPLFVVSRDEQLTLVVHGYLFDLADESFDRMPETNNTLTLTFNGSDGSSVPIYTSTGSEVDVWPRAPGFSVSARIDNRVNVRVKPEVKYDLVAKFLTKVRVRIATVVGINERLKLSLDLGLIRPPVPDF
jgi:hypothetical protein